jgi:PKD repeat protein
VGDTVTLFLLTGSGGISNSFASIQPSPGPGLIWSEDAVNPGQFDVIVAPAPVAGFSGMPTNIFVTQTVVFTNTSTGPITSSAWSFGDGNVTNTSGASAANNVSHTYNTTGNYTVTLVVTGPGGSSTNTQTAYIAVKPNLAVGNPVLSSGSLTFSGTNGPIGQQYRILITTNVALNVTNWIPVFTNVFTPPNGSYNYTSPALTNKASFYRLVSP